MKATPPLSYAQSLRVIGESLEAQGISRFDLEKHGENYMLRVVTNQLATEGSSLKKIAQRLLRVGISAKEPADSAVVAQSRCFTPSDIFRLATQQQSRHGGLNAMPDAYKLAQVLRVVGDHLDRKEACALQFPCLATRFLSRMKPGAVIKYTRTSLSKIYMTAPSKCTCAGRNGLRESTDYRARNFCTEREEKACFIFSTMK